MLDTAALFEALLLYFLLDKHTILTDILPAVPDIGNSLFSFNYKFGVCYIAWYKALIDLETESNEAVKEIWTLTGDFLRLVPRPIMRIAAKFYLKTWRKKAPCFEKLGSDKRLHQFDYKIRFIEVDKNTFEIHFYECGMKKLFEKFNVADLMPGVCRVDYLMFNYMGVGFARDKTLGDGNDHCNCRYSIKGFCEWTPEKGFEHRK